MIVSHAPSSGTGAITGVAGRKGFSVITIEKDMMNAELGFGRRVLEVLEKQGYVNFLAPSFPKNWGKEKRDRKTVPGVLNAKDYGVPQNRERVYMVSIRKDILGDTQYEFPRPFPLEYCIADILYEDVEEKFFLQPDSVIKFLHKNADDDSNGIYYMVTDHKLTDEEIAEVRRTKGGKN